MSYGFKFFNNNSEIVLDDTSTKPWYFGQASVLQIYDQTISYTELNKLDANNNYYTTFPASDAPGVTKWNVYKVRYSVPAAYDCFVCFQLPNSSRAIYYAFEKPYALIGDTFIDILVFVPNTLVAATSDIPRAYIFVTNPVPAANLGTGYGVQIFNGSTQCMYDSTKRHFQPESIPLIYIPDPTDFVYTNGTLPINDSVAVSFPTNAAVLLPDVDVVYVEANGTTANATHYKAIYRRVNNVLRVGVPKVYITDSSTSYTSSGYFNRGSVGVQPMIILNGTPLDQGYSPPEFPASYTLTVAPASLEEGLANSPELYRKNVAIVTLDTAGVANGTLVAYTITGISSSDITTPLTGNFTVSGNRATVTITALADGVFEGIETATLTLNNGKASVVFTISDEQTYSLSSSKSSAEEGQSILVYLNTTNVANGTLVPYNISGIQQADLTVGTLSGNFTVATSGTSGTAQFQLTFAKDSVLDSETATITLPDRGIALNVSVLDVPAGYNEVLSITPSSASTADSVVIQITGGVPNSSFEWIILPTGTNPVESFNNYWNSTYASTAQNQILYFDSSGNFYNSVTGGDFGTGNRTLWIFTTVSRNFRSANIFVSAVPTFSLTGSNGTKGPLTIAEGATGYFLVTTTNLPNGTVVYPKLVGPSTASAADIVNSAESGLVINNNTGSFTIQFVADNSTEGDEYFQLVLDYPNGTRRDTYGTINIVDTSLTPATYSVTRSTASVNEGSFVTFTYTSNQPGSVYWTLTGMDFADIWFVEYFIDDQEFGGYWQSQGQINSGQIALNGQVRVYFSNDQITEGTQTATFSVHSGSITGTVLASASVTINDTSVYPAAGTASGGPYCVGFNKYQNYHNGSGGTYATLLESNSSYCGYVTYNESLAYTSDAWGDYIVPTSGFTTVSITGGAPNTGFTYATLNNTDPQPTSFPGSGTLDGNGNFTSYLQGYQIIGPVGSTGDKRTWVKFNYNGNVRSARVNIVPDPGTLSGGQYCSGTTLYQNKHDGRGGIYAEVVQTNSPTCGYVQQYNPYTAANWYYYNQDFVHDLWYVFDTKPNSTVNYKIVAGPGGVGNNVNVTSDGSGTAVYDVGNAAYGAGTYTVNVTFPGNDASYPVNKRTLVVYWIVYNASGGSGGGY